MIVVCSSCQARFKVADEKIGPRGAKVRCSKCQTVFVVHRELGVVGSEAPPPAAATPPAPPPPAAPRRPAGGLDLDLESEPMGGTRPSGFIADPFFRPPPPSAAADPFASHDPFGAPSPGLPAQGQPSPPSPLDPFGGADPFGGGGAEAPSAAPSAAVPDPFGGFQGGGAPGWTGVDPFVATVTGPAPGVPGSAVTDLSDLLGVGGAGGSAQAAPGQPGPGSPGFQFDAGPSGSAGPELDKRRVPGPQAGQAPAAPDPDLSLAERTPPGGRPAAGAHAVPMPGFGDFAGADPFEDPAAAPAAAAPPGGMHDFGGPEEDAFGAGPEPAEPAPPPRPPPPTLEPAAPPPSAPAAPAAAPAARPDEVAAEGLRHRASRIRSVAINALSLVALLAVVVALLALWRGLRPGSGGLLHPSALFSRPEAERREFEAVDLRSGRYERAEGPPLVFVTGKAISRAGAPVPGLAVHVELVGKGGVVARGDARAGAVPGPEALHAARDAAALAAAYEALAGSAPAAVRPGDAVPFLVAVLDAPADVEGLGLRVTVEPLRAPPEPPSGAAAPAPGEAATAPAPAPGGATRP